MSEVTVVAAAKNGLSVGSDANNVTLTEVDGAGEELAKIIFDRRDAKALAKAIVEASKTKPKTEPKGK